MIKLVEAANRDANAGLLRAMHADRRRVFVDWLKWDLAVTDGLEIDRFDDAHATYVIVTDDEDRHLGSVRLLPTTRDHILGSLFPQLCDGPVPTGPDVLEITRMVVSPRLPDKADQTNVRRRMALALMEYARVRRIRRYTAVTHMSFVPALLAIGWDAEPLGLPVEIDGTALGALVVNDPAAHAAKASVDWGLSSLQIDWSSAEAKAA